MRYHHPVKGAGNGGFDVARVLESENGDNVVAHHLGQRFGGVKLIRFGVFHLQDQIDVGQQLFLFDAFQSVGDGARNSYARLLAIARQGRQVADSQIQRWHRMQ